MTSKLTTPPDPERVRRGHDAIATARARGKFPEKFEPPCCVCDRSVPNVPPSRRRKRVSYRCPECVAAGRFRCPVETCGKEFETHPHAGGQRKCEQCRAAGRRGPTLRPRAELVEVHCVGATMPWGGRRHAEHCPLSEWRRPSEANDWKRSRSDGRHPRTNGWRSRECFTLSRFVREHYTNAKQLGYRISGWEAFSVYLRSSKDASVPGHHPAFVTKKGAYPAALIAARREGSGGLSGPARSRLSLTTTWGRRDRDERGEQTWRPRKPGEVAWDVRCCGLCGRLLLVSTARTAKRPKHHQACWREWRDSDKGTAWLRDLSSRPRRERAGRGGAPIPARPGRPPANLKRNFGWTVLHILGGVSTVALAKHSGPGVGQADVSKGVTAILALLPDPDVADQRMRRYVVALREAAERRQTV